MLHSIENSDTLRKVRRADSLVLVLNPAITDTTAQLSYLAAFTNRQKDACEDYWYHPDHLGSSSWVTDAHGEAVQHLHYLPLGRGFRGPACQLLRRGALHVLRQRKGLRNGPILLWLTLLQQRPVHLAERGSDE